MGYHCPEPPSGERWRKENLEPFKFSSAGLGVEVWGSGSVSLVSFRCIGITEGQGRCPY